MMKPGLVISAAVALLLLPGFASALDSPPPYWPPPLALSPEPLQVRAYATSSLQLFLIPTPGSCFGGPGLGCGTGRMLREVDVSVHDGVNAHEGFYVDVWSSKDPFRECSFTHATGRLHLLLPAGCDSIVVGVDADATAGLIWLDETGAPWAHDPLPPANP